MIYKPYFQVGKAEFPDLSRTITPLSYICQKEFRVVWNAAQVFSTG